MRELSKSTLIERSIIKKFRKQIWAPFIEAVKRYNLIEEGDRIAVCISGGKDSFLLAKLMQELHRHSPVSFELVFLAMDPGYNKANREKIEENARLMNIDVEIFESDIFDVANTVTKSPCYLCARMRRGHLYANAKERGCNKIALGHHMSDVIETTLMAMMHSSQLQAMLPRLKSTNFKGMELIRPMYCILEDAIEAWRDYNDLSFLQCACRFTENLAGGDGTGESKRQDTKILIKELKKTNADIEHNLFESIHNVMVDTFPEYKLSGERHSFSERFERGECDEDM